jgi:hypothetical protein
MATKDREVRNAGQSINAGLVKKNITQRRLLCMH